MKQETVLSQPDIEIFKLAKEREEKRSEGSKDMGKEGERERWAWHVRARPRPPLLRSRILERGGALSLALSLSLSLFRGGVRANKVVVRLDACRRRRRRYCCSSLSLSLPSFLLPLEETLLS